ncbi:MAG: Mu transposase C-terminal domain-containing protein [Bacillota bacterium]
MLPQLDTISSRILTNSQDFKSLDRYTGCISFQGNKYEVESQLVGEYITIRFDPNDLEKLEVWLDGKQFENAIPLNLSRPKHEKAASGKLDPTNEESGLNFLELTAPSHEIKKESEEY